MIRTCEEIGWILGSKSSSARDWGKGDGIRDFYLSRQSARPSRPDLQVSLPCLSTLEGEERGGFINKVVF